MLNRISIRWRMTLLSALLLTLCCIALTLFLNRSAILLADTSAAALISEPAMEIEKPLNPSLEQNVEVPLPMLTLEEAKQDYQIQSILIMLSIILGGSALTYAITGRALKPLHSLHAQVKNMSMKTLSDPIQVPFVKDEIYELGNSFNAMTDKLHEAFLTQQRFSASAAHELRTPLSVLQTKVDVFRKKPSPSLQDYEALIEVFEKQIKQLRLLVGNLLELSNQEEVIEKTTIDLSLLLHEVAHDLQEIADKKQISIYVFCKDSYTMKGNIELLYRAFYNLIENGINYNHEGGSIVIDVIKKDNQRIQINIKDTGIGIPDDKKAHIFEPFYRVDASRSRTMGGAGLGLSFVQMILEKHGGVIHVGDNQPQGSTFIIQL